MTTATMNDCSTAQPRGIDRLAVSFGSALVRWGRVRAERAVHATERRASHARVAEAVEAREHSIRRYGIVG